MHAEKERDVAGIAAGLTKAQRAAILRAGADGALGYLFVRWWHASGRTLRALIKQGLGTSVWSGLTLTPLGLEVRQHLLEQNNVGR